MKKMLILGALVFALFACEDNGDDDIMDEDVTLTYEFENDAEGWTGDFADYPVGEEERFELNFEHTTLPPPLDESEGALGISGTNLSDDLYTLKTVTSDNPISITTDNNGQLWLIVGTDSGFEGNTTIYYNKITAVLDR